MSDELIRMDKEYVTRDGRAVRVLCVDRKDDGYPVVALVGDEQRMAAFTAHGLYGGTGGSSDLIPKPVKHTRTVWLNIYHRDIGSYYGKKFMADIGESKDRIACKEITFEFEEGEGL
jgi:hypothetical protein